MQDQRRLLRTVEWHPGNVFSQLGIKLPEIEVGGLFIHLAQSSRTMR